MSLDDNSDDDWFNKDEEELLKDIKINTASNDDKPNQIEHINCSEEDENYLHNRRLATGSSTKTPKAAVSRISTSEMRRLAENSDALEVFLYVFTQERLDFFAGQIASNDSMERVIFCLHIFTMISDLKIPGFHLDIIKLFVQNIPLLEQLRVIATKMFSKRYNALWTTDHDTHRFDQIIYDVQALFIQAYKLDVITPKCIETIEHILRLIDRSDFPKMKNRSICEELQRELEYILSDTKRTATLKLEKPVEIFPTLEELLPNITDTTTDINNYFKNVSLLDYEYDGVLDYLQIQQQTLRADFMISLSTCIRELKNKKLSPQFEIQTSFFERVQIVLNEEFLNARRHEMLFVDVDPNKCSKKRDFFGISQLKTGSLLCFSTDFEFENLILAVVTYQDADISRSGYIAIEVVRQFNIGNIYNKDLIMFSSPAFFEPYHHVYNYLTTCGVDDFPMKEYIVFGNSDMPMPSYLTPKKVFNTGKCSFKPAQEPPPQALPLNASQREAVKQCLTQKFVLVQGPPGTGKTHISAQIVKLLVENRIPKPIIVVAYTNESLDKFLLKISNDTRSIARFGSQTRQPEIARFNVHENAQSNCVNPRLKRLYFLVKTRYKASFEELQVAQKEFDGSDEGYQLVLTAQHKVRAMIEQLNTIRMLFKYYVVRDRSVVALTTTCAAKMNFLLRLLQSQIVIFEEAAEILESHVLACLTPHVQHVIQIGDHEQLKPYTSYNQHSRSSDLNVSLFERLVHRSILKPAILLTQYRMRPIIAELLYPIFYETLHNDETVEHYPIVRKMQENLYFITHDHIENKSLDRLSVYNKKEAALVIDLAAHLIKTAKYDCGDIVILSPYASQVNFIKSKLPTNLKSIRVSTVDSFQGLEANIVLLSLVRNNKDGRIGFLKEKNRICVALSRARYGLYIFGAMHRLSACCETWRAIENKLKSYNLIGNRLLYTQESNEEDNISSDEEENL